MVSGEAEGVVTNLIYEARMSANPVVGAGDRVDGLNCFGNQESVNATHLGPK